MNEPLVGTPLLKVLMNGSCDGSVVAVVPQWITAIQFHVSPICDPVNVFDSVNPTRFLCGDSVKTCEVRTNGMLPLPSLASMDTAK